MEGYRKEDEGRSLLVEYDLDSAAVRRRVEPPAGAEGARLSDLAVAPSGDVFVADPVHGRVYVLRQGEASLRVLTPEGPIGSAQGIAVSPDGALFVADYTQGIVRVDSAYGRGAARCRCPTTPPSPASTASCSTPARSSASRTACGRTAWCGCGSTPRRERVTAVETLERNHPDFDEPTARRPIADGVLYYVANSQYDRVREDGSPRHRPPPPAP